MKKTYIVPSIIVQAVHIECVLQDLSNAQVYNPITQTYEEGGPNVDGEGNGEDQARAFTLWEDWE